ncbi:uncharacterized protein LOC144410214 isoform X2 [Gasterosteus aculeatus]
MCRLLAPAALLLLSIVPTVTEVVRSMSDCKGYFLNDAPPNIPGILEGGNILDQNRYKPICQTWENETRFVTLYDTVNKIPVFSAYRYRGHESGRRKVPWKIEPQLEDVNANKNMMRCEENAYEHQAADDNYKRQEIYDRGHLFPNSYALREDDKSSTFTLTNIVPQVGTFNKGSWNKMEKCIKCVLDEYCKDNNNKPEGFLVTGAQPGNGRMNNIVNVPSALWSAFCCYSRSEGQWLASAHWGENVEDRGEHLQTKTLIELEQEIWNVETPIFPGTQCPLNTTVSHLYPNLKKTCDCPPNISTTSAPPTTAATTTSTEPSTSPASTSHSPPTTSGPFSTTSGPLSTSPPPTTSGPFSTTSGPLSTSPSPTTSGLFSTTSGPLSTSPSPTTSGLFSTTSGPLSTSPSPTTSGLFSTSPPPTTSGSFSTTSGPLSTLSPLTTSGPFSTSHPPPTTSGPLSTSSPPTTSGPLRTSGPPPTTSGPFSTSHPPPTTSGPLSTSPSPTTSGLLSTTSGPLSTSPSPTTSGPLSTSPSPTTSGLLSTSPPPTTSGSFSTTSGPLSTLSPLTTSGPFSTSHPPPTTSGPLSTSPSPTTSAPSTTTTTYTTPTKSTTTKKKKDDDKNENDGMKGEPGGPVSSITSLFNSLVHGVVGAYVAQLINQMQGALAAAAGSLGGLENVLIPVVVIPARVVAVTATTQTAIISEERTAKPSPATLIVSTVAQTAPTAPRDEDLSSKSTHPQSTLAPASTLPAEFTTTEPSTSPASTSHPPPSTSGSFSTTSGPLSTSPPPTTSGPLSTSPPLTTSGPLSTSPPPTTSGPLSTSPPLTTSGPFSASPPPTTSGLFSSTSGYFSTSRPPPTTSGPSSSLCRHMAPRHKFRYFCHLQNWRRGDNRLRGHNSRLVHKCCLHYLRSTDEDALY